MSEHGHSDPAAPGPPQRPPEVPDEPLVLGEGDGVRTLYCHAPSMRQLMETLTAMLSEHVSDADELHVSYSAMQSGWQEQSAPSPGYAAAPGAWTQIFFEYSAVVVLRPRGR